MNEARWGRDAREEVYSTAASRAEARRQESAAAHAQTEYMAAADVRMAELERRVAEVENRLSSFDELARATSEFGTAVESQLNALAAITERLDHKLSDLRVAQKHEYDLLRERFVVAERAHAATDAALTRRLSETARDRRSEV